MFKAMKIKRMQQNVNEIREMLQHMINQTEEIKDEAFRNILHIKWQKRLNWTQALKNPSVCEELF